MVFFSKHGMRMRKNLQYKIPSFEKFTIYSVATLHVIIIMLTDYNKLLKIFNKNYKNIDRSIDITSTRINKFKFQFNEIRNRYNKYYDSFSSIKILCDKLTIVDCVDSDDLSRIDQKTTEMMPIIYEFLTLSINILECIESFKLDIFTSINFDSVKQSYKKIMLKYVELKPVNLTIQHYNGVVNIKTNNILSCVNNKCIDKLEVKNDIVIKFYELINFKYINLTTSTIIDLEKNYKLFNLQIQRWHQEIIHYRGLINNLHEKLTNSYEDQLKSLATIYYK